MRVSTYYRGEYLNITYELVKHGSVENPIWNTYFYLRDPEHKEFIDLLWSKKYRRYKKFNKQGFDTYLEHSILLDELDWNGGITLYKQSKHKHGRTIQVGDDYNHSWNTHTIHYNELEKERKIKSIIEHFVAIMNQLISHKEIK